MNELVIEDNFAGSYLLAADCCQPSSNGEDGRYRKMQTTTSTWIAAAKEHVKSLKGLSDEEKDKRNREWLKKSDEIVKQRDAEISEKLAELPELPEHITDFIVSEYKRGRDWSDAVKQAIDEAATDERQKMQGVK